MPPYNINALPIRRFPPRPTLGGPSAQDLPTNILGRNNFVPMGGIHGIANLLGMNSGPSAQAQRTPGMGPRTQVQPGTGGATPMQGPVGPTALQPGAKNNQKGVMGVLGMLRRPMG